MHYVVQNNTNLGLQFLQGKNSFKIFQIPMQELIPCGNINSGLFPGIPGGLKVR